MIVMEGILYLPILLMTIAKVPILRQIIFVSAVFAKCGTLVDPIAVLCGVEHQADMPANVLAKPCILGHQLTAPMLVRLSQFASIQFLSSTSGR